MSRRLLFTIDSYAYLEARMLAAGDFERGSIERKHFPDGERYVRLGYATTANLIVPRQAFDAVAGFDARRFSGGDADFCRRAERAGHGIVLVAAAVVEHPARDSWEEVATKARRVKGGQITGGPLGLRIRWFLRTLIPPLRATARFIRAPRPWSERLTAIRVLYRLWLVELAEMARLLAGGTPERR